MRSSDERGTAAAQRRPRIPRIGWACRATRIVAVATALACLAPGAGACIAAQLPVPARPDTARPPADTARRARDERVRIDSVRRDSVRRAPPDSALRDSVVARQLRAEARRDAPVYRRVGLDRLRLTAVGVSAGLAKPDQVVATPLYAVHADYGEVAPYLRVVFGLAYWSSHFTDRAVAGYARAVADAAGVADVHVGRVRASDVVLNADLHYRPQFLRGRRLPLLGLRPWISAGPAVHLFDVQGAPLTGTFVERALDGIAFGGAAALGADVRLLPNVQLMGQARYDLFNGAHFGTVRAGASYVLDRRYGP